MFMQFAFLFGVKVAFTLVGEPFKPILVVSEPGRLARVISPISALKDVSTPLMVAYLGLLLSFRSVYKELHADHETGAADNK